MTSISLFDIARARREVHAYQRVRSLLRQPGRKSGMTMALAQGRKNLVAIAVEVANSKGLTFEEMMADTRQRDVAWPRQEFMLAAHREGYSMPEIGALIGRDHTTVLHGIRAAKKREAQE